MIYAVMMFARSPGRPISRVKGQQPATACNVHNAPLERREIGS